MFELLLRINPMHCHLGLTWGSYGDEGSNDKEI
jgi:hypothetical protein